MWIVAVDDIGLLAWFQNIIIRIVYVFHLKQKNKQQQQQNHIQIELLS